MSRIGKLPIPVPSGVSVDVQNNHLKVQGPRGVLERGRAVQRLFGSSGCGQSGARGCLCDRLPAPTRGLVLCAAEAAGQNRPDVAGQATHRGPLASRDGGRLQERRDGGADARSSLALAC